MSLKITADDIFVIDSWISVNKIGIIGLYKAYDKAIGLDYSMKYIVGTNADIPCERYEIIDKVLELINNQKDETTSTSNSDCCNRIRE